ncbi:Unknown protein [Striga hermonthica]|uniref:F-box/LRR-repeat protein 15/At3g58940/PEG3-like LRR domain-containing protein n=1 Tax=Striga hermonthica TaxID=68872 RepID=A0A9N7NNI6_STRHE|nr:Unknown protein [Striga hermonthica]
MRNKTNINKKVFLAESLEELHLCQCRVSPVESVRFKCLRKLTVEQVQVDDRTFETIMLGCPLLRSLVLKSCWELRNFRLSEAASPRLKHFVLCHTKRIEGRSIEIDVLNIETVNIAGPWIWSHRQSTLLFSPLTSLRLYDVIMSSKSFDWLSFSCPALVSLALQYCSGFEEFHLESNSVKYLHIWTKEILLKRITICVPNIVKFNFNADILQVPDTFSFTTTTSKEWSSKVFLYSSREEDPDFDVTSWFPKLRRLLKALSGSQIYLSLQMNGDPQNVPCSAVVSNELPVVVWILDFTTYKCRTVSWYSGFTNVLFRVCQPSHIWGCSLVNKSTNNYKLSEF